MKKYFKVDGKAAGLAAAMAAKVGKGSYLDYAKMIRFDVSGDRLYLTCYGEATSLYFSIPISGEGQSFSFGADTSALDSFLSCKKDVSFTLEDRMLTLESGRSKLKTSWLDVDEYPSFPMKDLEWFKVDSSCFVPALKKSSLFIIEDEFRPELSNTLLSIKNGYIDVVSTDRYVLFRHTGKSEGDIPPVMVSPTVTSILYSIFKDSDEELEIASDGASVYFRTGVLTIFDRGTERKFPDYKKLFDSFRADFSFKTNRKDFLSSLEDISSAGKDDCWMIGKEGKLIVRSEDLQAVRYAESEVEVEGAVGDFDARTYLGRMKLMAKGFTGRDILVEYSGASKMLRITSEEDEGTEVLFSTKHN